MCIRGKCRLRWLGAGVLLLWAGAALAQAVPTSYAGLDEFARPEAPAVQPEKIPDAVSEVAPAPAAEPVKAAAPATAKVRARKKAAPKPAPAAPLDPASSGGTTRQDPTLLLGVVAFALYRRYHQDPDFLPAYTTLPPDAPELLRNCARQLANPGIVLPPELPRAFRTTSFSWTATVPGSVPARLPATTIAAKPEPPKPAPPPPASEAARTRVLLVGGEASWVQFQSEALRGDGAEVEACPAMQRAVDVLARERFDVVIVDSEMTGDNAAPAIRRWLARNRPGMEKRLIVSVGNLDDARTAALLDEARALTLTRPCGVHDLLVIVRLAAQRRALAPA